MFTNGINSYNAVREDSSKPRMDNQGFDFDGEAFSDLMDEKPAGKGLRETAQELAEDESILSTDEENRAMIKKKPEQSEAPKPHFAMEEDKARLLKLMDMSNKLNMINITKSKKELENTVGPAIEENDEPEDITAVIAKLMAGKESDGDVENDDIEASVNLEKHPEDFDEDNNGRNSQILHETEEELLEDMSILSTEEENLEMARRNSMQHLSDEDYKTTEDDMLFMNDIVALNNQVQIEKSDKVQNTQNVLSALMNQTRGLDTFNRMTVEEMRGADVDCIIGILRRGSASTASFTNEDNDELDRLSRKFLELLRDSIANHKVFRIDFDNDISVIIKVNVDGKITAEFQTSDDAIETYLKNNLHVLKEKFNALNVDGDVSYKKISEE
ncbi:MAG: hypothetical protein NC200_03195 [Candidatus Gastranaerophilales bacterium]|nr:hypothetical protein [Candidatus Gastranaerophilales bacterium]